MDNVEKTVGAGSSSRSIPRVPLTPPPIPAKPGERASDGPVFDASDPEAAKQAAKEWIAAKEWMDKNRGCAA